MSATSASGSSMQLAGFPRIDRYFPQCWCAAVEAAAKHSWGISDFGKIYGWHGFSYEAAPGTLSLKENGVELDVWFHRPPLAMSELEQRIADIYGIRADLEYFRDWSDYLEHCFGRLRAGVPVVTDFDLGFIEERREFGKVLSPHVVVLYGFDAETQRFSAAEQMIGTISIGLDTLARCFEHKLGTLPGTAVWTLSRCGDERELQLEELRLQAQSNLNNLRSSSASLGLNALRRFHAALGEHVRQPSFDERPFSVPGLWVFSHERHVERKWLKSLAAAGVRLDAGFVQDMDAKLGQLFQRWLNVDYLLEKCLMAESGKALRSLPDHLAPIIAAEQGVTESWAAIFEALPAETAHARVL